MSTQKKTNTVLRSLSQLGVSVPNIAYCSVNMYFDNVHFDKTTGSKGKPPKLKLRRGGKRYTITCDSATRNWLDIDTVHGMSGQGAYLNMPAYVAASIIG